MTRTVSVLLPRGGREGGCSSTELRTAAAGFSSGPTWRTSYSSSLSACQSKTPALPFLSQYFSVKKKKKKKDFLLSHLETRGGEPLSERLNGARPVVLDEIWHRVVSPGVSVDHKLPRYALVDQEVSTAISTSANKQSLNHWSLLAGDPSPNVSRLRETHL